MRTTPQVSFSVANRSINAVISSPTGGRPGGLGWRHFAATKRRCHRNNVPGVAIRQTRTGLGSIHDNAASTARSDHTSRGIGFARNTATSCRNTKISASFHADDRASNTNHDNTRTEITYTSRTATAADHHVRQTARSNQLTEFSTRTGTDRDHARR
jgi:hypothetical protein